MKNNLLKVGFLLLISMVSVTIFTGAVGDILRSVMTDSSGLIQNTPLSSSNQISMIAAPSAAQHLVRFLDTTNGNLTSFRVGMNTVRQDTFTNLTYTTIVSSNSLTMGPAIRLSAASVFKGAGYSISNGDMVVSAQSFWTIAKSGMTFINSTSNITISADNGTLTVGPKTTFNESLTASISVTSLTNNSTIYQVNSIRGFTGSVTNMALANTNVEVFAEGLLTNKFTIP